MAVLAILTLGGCGQIGQTHPRLQSIAATGSEATPSPSPTLTPTPSPTPEPTVEPSPEPVVAGPPPCPSGAYQLEVETALAKTGNYGHITVDGKQTAEDCATIIAFQKRMGINPANGTPGPTTKDVSIRIAATDPTQCPVSDAAVACIDLTHQTFYIAKGGQVIVGPTVTRTGMRGWATPSGTFRIANKTAREWSVPFKVWMPYWQRFYFGDGLHETTTYIHNMSIGSHGCVNLLHVDAQAAYQLLGVGSTVHLYGRRPGT
jgi:lipoprotein-anchoring transpeptidase ErfK/SrfK